MPTLPESPQPAHQPHGSETVRQDHGGWISGPSAETVAAEHVEVGDVLLLDGGIRAEVTDVQFGFYYFAEGREMGVAIGWTAGTSSGMLFRRATELLTRADGDR
jgi:hypothetical protein